MKKKKKGLLPKLATTQNKNLEQLKSVTKIVLPNTDTASEGTKLAVDCFKRLTEVGIHPTQVFRLVDVKGVEDNSDLDNLVKSISFWQLNRNEDYMKKNSLTAIRLQFIFNSVKVGESYTILQFRGFMQLFLNLEKGFHILNFDYDPTDEDVLSFIRLFFDISVHTKTKIWVIKGILNYDEYIIENKSKKRYPNELIFNQLEKKDPLSN